MYGTAGRQGKIHVCCYVGDGGVNKWVREQSRVKDILNTDGSVIGRHGNKPRNRRIVNWKRNKKGRK